MEKKLDIDISSNISKLIDSFEEKLVQDESNQALKEKLIAFFDEHNFKNGLLDYFNNSDYFKELKSEFVILVETILLKKKISLENEKINNLINEYFHKNYELLLLKNIERRFDELLDKKINELIIPIKTLSQKFYEFFIEDYFLTNVLFTPESMKLKFYKKELKALRKKVIAYDKHYNESFGELFFFLSDNLREKKVQDIEAFIDSMYHKIIPFCIEDINAKLYYALSSELDISKIKIDKVIPLIEQDYILPGLSGIIKFLADVEHYFRVFFYISYPNQKSSDAIFSKLRSYKWVGTKEQLFAMIEKITFIREEEKSKLEPVFSNININKISPVKLKRDSPSEVIFFILTLMEEEMIEKDYSNDNKVRFNYKRLQSCFVKPDGTPLTKNLKSLKYSVYENLSKDFQKDIRELINSL